MDEADPNSHCNIVSENGKPGGVYLSITAMIGKFTASP